MIYFYVYYYYDYYCYEQNLGDDWYDEKNVHDDEKNVHDDIDVDEEGKNEDY